MSAFCILVLSKSEQPTQILRELLPHDTYGSILFSSSIAQARRQLLARRVDLLIIDTPLKEESGIRFANEIAQRSSPGLLVLMNASLYHQLAAPMEDAGIPVLAKPVSRQAPYPSVRCAPCNSASAVLNRKHWCCRTRCRRSRPSTRQSGCSSNVMATARNRHTVIC
mgnify:CR=1 FL=1